MKKTILILSALFANLAFTQHQHGIGELNVALENQTLAIELHIPAGDVLGFEHKPETKKEIKTFQEINSYFENTSNWLDLPKDASCTISEQHIHFEIENGEEVNLEKKHDHSGHHHHHEEKKKSEHMELKALLSLECKKIDQLKALDLNLFKKFKHLKINYTAIGSKQSTGTLSVEKSSLGPF